MVEPNRATKWYQEDTTATELATARAVCLANTVVPNPDLHDWETPTAAPRQ